MKANSYIYITIVLTSYPSNFASINFVRETWY